MNNSLGVFFKPGLRWHCGKPNEFHIELSMSLSKPPQFAVIQKLMRDLMIAFSMPHPFLATQWGKWVILGFPVPWWQWNETLTKSPSHHHLYGYNWYNGLLCENHPQGHGKFMARVAHMCHIYYISLGCTLLRSPSKEPAQRTRKRGHQNVSPESPRPTASMEVGAGVDWMLVCEYEISWL